MVVRRFAAGVIGAVCVTAAMAAPDAPLSSILLPLEQAWLVDLGGAPAAAPVVGADLVFVPLRSGHVAAVALADGKTVWKIELSTTLPLAADSGTVFVSSATELRALDGASGRIRWQAALGEPASAPPVFETGWLIVTLESGSIVALRAADGREMWRRDMGAPVRVRPSVGGDRLFVPVEDGRIAALHLHTGEPVWERRLDGSPQEILPLDALFVGSTDNFFYRIRLRDGAVDWRWRTGGDIVGSAAVDAARVYFVSMDNVLRALDRHSGSQRWQSPLAGRPASGPVHLDRLLLVAGVAPEVRVVDAGSGRLLASVAAPGELAAAPAVVMRDADRGPLVVVVTGDGRLLALRQALKPPLVAPPMPIGRPAFDAEVPLVPLADALRNLGAPPPPAQTSAAPPTTPGFTVQVAALSDRSAAAALAQRLTSRGFPAYVLDPAPGGGPRLYRIRVGHFADSQSAQQLANRLVSEERLETFIVAVP